jgi:tetratricopeptide (TPR) repeat protein
LTREFVIGLVLAIGSCGLTAQTPSDQGNSSPQPDPHEAPSDSEASLSALSRAQPRNPEPLARLGLLKARRGEYSEAIAFYRKAMALQPAMPGLRLNLGLALFKDGQFEQAIQTFGPLLKSQPSSSSEAQRVTVLLAMSYYGLGEYGAAVPYLKQAADRDQNNLSLLLTLAHSCLLSKQYDCVLESYHRIVELNAESAEADMLVGEALDELHDTIGATREFRAAVLANPKEPNAHFGLGYLLWTQLQYEEAAHEFQAELEIIPNYDKAFLYLADTELQMKRDDEARPLLEKVVASDPKNSMAHLDLGIVCANAGEKESALREFKAAAALKPEDVNVHMRLGRLYRSMGNSADAQKEFDKASNLTRASHDALLTVMDSDSEKKKALPEKIPTP